MRGADYAQLIAFLAVSRERSFRAAARQLGLAPSVVSRSIRELEDELGVRLLDRTTRSVSATDAGARLLERLAPALSEVSDALAAARDISDRPAGLLRVNLPRFAYQLAIEPRLAAFAARYPDIQLDLVIDDGLHDIVAAGFDLGIRVGGKVARDMIAVRLTPDKQHVVAGSPIYLTGRLPPKKPEELRDHACLNYRWSDTGATFPWRFTNGKSDIEVEVSGPLLANDSDVLVHASLAGLGLVYLPRERLQSYLDEGRLVEVLAGRCATVHGFFIYYANRRLERPVLRAFIDHFRS